MTAPAVMVHPILGTPLPAATVPVPRELRDWDWAGYESKRRPLVRLVLSRMGRTCHLCGQPGATTADHLIPWSHGGRNHPDNLAPAHMGCNRARSDRPLVDYFRRRPPVRRLEPSREWL